MIIFTSNKGIFADGPDGRKHPLVLQDNSKEIMRSTVKSAIRDYFFSELGKPEMLNRIGENIVIFDFIDSETADQILKSKIQKIFNTRRDFSIDLVWAKLQMAISAVGGVLGYFLGGFDGMLTVRVQRSRDL